MASDVHASGPLTDGNVSTVVIYANDLERMLKFYRDTLGLSVGHQTASYVELRGARGADIALHSGRRGDGEVDGHWFIEFRVEDIDATVKQLRSRGIDVSDVEERWWGKEAGFSDPEGNRLELEEPAEEIHQA